MKRIFNLLLGIVTLILLAILMLLVAIAIRLSSKGPVLYWSDRVGEIIKYSKCLNLDRC
jgi:O-antigen biosynthesis protein WbqP